MKRWLLPAALLICVFLCACGVGEPAAATDTGAEAEPADAITDSAETAEINDISEAGDAAPAAPEPAERPDVSSLSYAELADWRDDPAVLAEWKETHDVLDALEWEAVESSAIRETAYSWLWGAAAVRFHSNPAAVYVYYDVPEDVYNELVGADSVGGYYNACIKGQYVCERFD